MPVNRVTQHEYVLAPNLNIVSRTDLKGNITWANEDFIEASGYDWSELVNQPHNLLRHPDVPSAVFKDFWSTIQAGKPWSQIVKNRRKNGDHYWVEAQATPIFESGKIVGYMSVRKPASREQIKLAEFIYSEIAKNRIKIEAGKVKPNLIKKAAALSSRFEWLLMVLLVSLITALFGAFLDPSIFTLLFGLLGAIGLILYTIQSNRIKKIQYALNYLIEGNYTVPIDCDQSDGLGVLSCRIKSMAIKLGAEFDDIKANLNHAKRLEMALQATSANIMVADKFRSIIFVNHAVQEMLQAAEQEIRKDLPEFEAKNLLHKSIDVFHKIPSHQINVLENLQATHGVRIGLSTLFRTQRRPFFI